MRALPAVAGDNERNGHTPKPPARPAKAPVLTHATRRDAEDEVRRGDGACIRCLLSLRSTSTSIVEAPRSSFAGAARVHASTPTPHKDFGCQHYHEFADDMSECLDAETDDALQGRASH